MECLGSAVSSSRQIHKPQSLLTSYSETEEEASKTEGREALRSSGGRDWVKELLSVGGDWSSLIKKSSHDAPKSRFAQAFNSDDPFLALLTMDSKDPISLAPAPSLQTPQPTPQQPPQAPQQPSQSALLQPLQPSKSLVLGMILNTQHRGDFL